MKILFIITDYGSFNNFLGELAVQLQKINNSVYVICDKDKVINYQDKFPYKEIGINFYWLDFSRNFRLSLKIRTSRKIHNIIRYLQPDIVNIHFTTGVLTSVLWGKINSKTHGVFHGLNYTIEKNPIKRLFYKAIETFCFKRIDQIWLLNNLDYNIVKKRFPYKTFKYNSLGVGCDIVKFNPLLFNHLKKNEIRESLDIGNDVFVLMYTGRFVHFKGFHLLIQAFRLLENKRNDIKLILVGGRDPAHPTGLTSDEESYYEQSTKIINIGFTSEVEKYLSITDLFVFPSKKEGIPVCIMEAIAMGVPTITLDARGCNDLITNDINGILLPVDATPIDVAEEILKLVSNKDKLKNLSENCLSMRTKVDRKHFIQETIDIFNSK